MLATPIDTLRYRGRALSAADINGIRQLIAANPTLSRHALSQELCRIWDWKQQNGALRDMVCRGLMLMLHRAGVIELPAVRNSPAAAIDCASAARAARSG